MPAILKREFYTTSSTGLNMHTAVGISTRGIQEKAFFLSLSVSSLLKQPKMFKRHNRRIDGYSAESQRLPKTLITGILFNAKLRHQSY